MDTFLKNRFYQTIMISNAYLTAFSKVHYIEASKAEIRTWEKSYEEESEQKIFFDDEEEKSFEVEILQGDRSVWNKVKITDSMTNKTFIYPLDNDASEFAIGEHTFELGIPFEENEYDI